MSKGPKVDSAELLSAGLELMRRNNQALEKVPSRGRAMVYKRGDGQTVRVRTCNDHLLIAGADKPTPDARLKIEGTDWLLIVMPVVERTPGDAIAYLVPTHEAVDAVRRAHSEWLAGSPDTAGQNNTWTIWFNDKGPATSNKFFEKWDKYKLQDSFQTDQVQHEKMISLNKEFASSKGEGGRREAGCLALSLQDAKKALAAFYGVSVEAIEITIRG